MEIFQFDRREKVIEYHGSQGMRATRIAAGDGEVRLTCLALEPGGVIGTHPATVPQLFLVISGEGWTAGPDHERVPVAAGWGVRWEQGEIHTTGTDTGLVALAVEGAPLSLFAPEPPGEGAEARLQRRLSSSAGTVRPTGWPAPTPPPGTPPAGKTGPAGSAPSGR